MIQDLDRKIRERQLLTKQKGLVEARIAELTKEIKAALHENDHFYANERYQARLILKRPRAIDEGVAAQLLVDKDLWADCTRRMPDPSLIEQAYLEGKLNDGDMRILRGNKDVTFTLDIQDIEV